MVRLPASEPAVLQRIIGQPVTVMPAGLARLQAQEMLADGAPADETQPDETEFNPNAGRASTSQRYLILLCLVAAVIFPLCWAGLGAIRPDHDKTSTPQAPRVAPRHNGPVSTPLAPSPPDAAADVEAPPGTMQPGDAAMPAGAGTAAQPGTSGSQAETSGSAVGADEPGGGPIGINLRIPGHVSTGRGARVSGGAHAPGGTGATAAAGASSSAARATAATRGAASSDTTNMSADSGGSAGLPGEHEEVPDVPAQIRKTIRGHVKVSVRVIIDQGGSVFAALVDNPGPSRYFDKVAIEAAKKWTFPPAESSSRLKVLRFDFTRDGTTGQAVEVQ
jgi:TonB family protein